MTDASSPAPIAATEIARQTSGATAMLTLARREWLRFVRQPSRLIGALLTPIAFWLLLGLGLNDALRLGETEAAGQGYLQYFFVGTLLLIVLFTAVFSTISIIDDRRAGFLQGVLAAPIPRSSIVLGKVLAGAALATGQGALFLAVWPVIFGWPGWVPLIATLMVLAVLAAQVAALGVALAWLMRSVSGFHAIMNVLLLPMWLLSGAAFAGKTAPPAIAALMWINPLSYGYTALAGALNPAAARMQLVGPATALAVTLALTVAALALAMLVVARTGTKAP